MSVIDKYCNGIYFDSLLNCWDYYFYHDIQIGSGTVPHFPPPDLFQEALAADKKTTE
jgi:hypothetical protein